MNDQQLTLWQFMAQQSDKLSTQTLQHIGLTFISLIIAVFAGLPLGIFIARRKAFAGAVLGVAGVLQTIPSIALLGFMIPVLGIGPNRPLWRFCCMHYCLFQEYVHRYHWRRQQR